VIAEHGGYERLPQPVTHRRTVTFNKSDRWWLVADDISGEGEHELAFRFHLAPELGVKVRPDGIIEVCDKMNGARMLIVASGITVQAGLEERFSSRDYGAKQPSVSVYWRLRRALPVTAYFGIVPIASGENVGDSRNLKFQI
jgi:hypothetical protein